MVEPISLVLVYVIHDWNAFMGSDYLSLWDPCQVNVFAQWVAGDCAGKQKKVVEWEACVTIQHKDKTCC